jgi:hypothetical protein
LAFDHGRGLMFDRVIHAFRLVTGDHALIPNRALTIRSFFRRSILFGSGYATAAAILVELFALLT